MYIYTYMYIYRLCDKAHSEVQFLWVCGIRLDNSTKDVPGRDPDRHAKYVRTFFGNPSRRVETLFPKDSS